MKIGYARVSSADQNLEIQLEALKREGCDKIYSDKCSGSKEARPGLDDALAHLRSGDTLVCWKLDRLGRSLKHLLQLISDFEERSIEVHFIKEKIDTSTPTGRLMFSVIGAIAEFEREMIRERCAVGRQRARARGRIGGRKSVMTDSKLQLAQTMYDANNWRVHEICMELDISASTFYRHVKKGDKKNGIHTTTP